MQRIHAFAKSDFNSTISRVPVSTKNASNKKTFLAVATGNAAESLAAAQGDRYANYVHKDGSITGVPSEVTTVTPMHHHTHGQKKIGLRSHLAQPKIMGTSKSTGITNAKRKGSIQ